MKNTYPIKVVVDLNLVKAIVRGFFGEKRGYMCLEVLANIGVGW
jgi:hypothetical protein